MHIWIAGVDGALVRFDAGSARPDRAGHVGHAVTSLALGRDGLWAVGGGRHGRASLVDPHDLSVGHTVPVGPHPVAVAAVHGDPVLLRGGRRPRLVRPPEPGRSAMAAVFRLGTHSQALCAGFGSLWVARQSRPAHVDRIDPGTGRVVASVRVHRDPQCLICGRRSVYVAADSPGAVDRIDPESMEVTATVGIPRQPAAICEAYGSVWVTHGSLPRLTMIAADTFDAAATIRVGAGSFGIAPAGGRLWLTQTLASKVAVVDPVRRGVADRFDASEPLAIVSGSR